MEQKLASSRDIIDAETYRNELFALDLYLRRTSTGHAKVRIVGSLAIIALVAGGFGGQYLPWVTLWALFLIGCEVLAYRNVSNYFRDGPIPMADDGSIDGRHVTVGAVRMILYAHVLVPTILLTIAYCAPCFFLAQMPGSTGPAIGVMVCIVTLLNIAAQHVYRTSLPFISIIAPGLAILTCLNAISNPTNQAYFLGFGVFLIILTLSMAVAGAKTQTLLVEARQEAEIEAIARQHADEANRAKSQFLANMSHELRTPLNAIIGYSEMMQEDAEMDGRDADVDDHKRIILAGKRLLLNINDILDFSKIEAGRMEAEIGQFDLRDMINDAADTIRPALAEKNVELKITLPDQLPAAWSDQHKLGQCMLNLLSNAAKFTHEGCIEIEGRVEDIAGFAGFVIEVRDTGIGMSKEHLSRIFQPFSQADSTFTRKYGGTGLGLVITERLIGLLGGTISVHSEEGKGSIFRLHFPIMTQLGNQCEGNDDCHIVLVIDDDRDAFELIARDLHSIGITTRHAVTAEEGRQIMARNTPDLIILDMHLPGENGIEFLKSIKANAQTADIPVIAHTVDSDRQQSLDAGATLHLTKPTPRETLLASVVRLALHTSARNEMSHAEPSAIRHKSRRTA